ncbi:MAG: hypothetical protein ABJE47_10255 [bacterium]
MTRPAGRQEDIPREVDRLRETIARELRRAGVVMPESRFQEVAETVLTDAISIAVRWMEE